MGVLKAKVGGNWINVGAGGGAPLPGGAAGDVMVKQSATANDLIWTTQMPKLHLTSPNIVTLASTDHPLTLGTIASTNLGMYSTGIQARNNGVAATLRLNYYGGQVVLAGNDASQYPLALSLADAVHATSRRAAIQVGTGWLIGQDINGNGTKDFFVYSNNAARIAFSSDINASTVTVGPGATTVQLGPGGTPACQVRIGDDAFLADVNTAHTMAVCSVSNTAAGFLRFGLNGPVIQSADGNYLVFSSKSSLYYDFSGVNYWRRTSDYASTMTLDTAGNLAIAGQLSGPTINMSGAITGATVTASGAMYASNWFRTYGQTGLYSESYAVGIQAVAAGWLSMYGGHLALSDNTIRLRAYSDANHYLVYSGMAASSVHPSSGTASNGPYLVGYTTTMHGNAALGYANFLHNGSLFLEVSYNYNKFSSVRIKEDIETMDGEEILGQVMRWRPVTFMRKDLLPNMPHRRLDGFIAEELHAVTPTVVEEVWSFGMTDEEVAERDNDPDRVHTGEPHAIDYGQLTVRLTAALQAAVSRIDTLTARIEQLELERVWKEEPYERPADTE